jgi:hypothetical protein
VFLEKYKEIEKRSKQNTSDGYKAQEQLTMFEYNFIVDSTR